MLLTKFGHSCVRLTDGERSLVIDPGGFSEVEEALEGAEAVLITHEHPDHVDAERLRSAAGRDSRLHFWAPASVAATLLADLGDRVTGIAPGTQLEVAGFSVAVLGGQHALIHPAIPVVANVGYLVDGTLYHPGDSLFVPPVEVQTLLAPIHAPWSKVSEVIDFIVAMRAPRVHQIHDGLLNGAGIALLESLIDRFAPAHGIDFHRLAVRDSVSV